MYWWIRQTDAAMIDFSFLWSRCMASQLNRQTDRQTDGPMEGRGLYSLKRLTQEPSSVSSRQISKDCFWAAAAAAPAASIQQDSLPQDNLLLALCMHAQVYSHRPIVGKKYWQCNEPWDRSLRYIIDSEEKWRGFDAHILHYFITPWPSAATEP